MLRAFSVLALVVPLTQQPPASSVQTPPTEVERLKRDLADAQEALGQARAERANCETTLGPVEAQLRRQSIDRDRAELKVAMEQARPGFECNPRTLECMKKPDPAKDPAVKK